MNSLYALIMAGGGGTRLWPLSRRNRPKQMLPLVEDRTMFQISVERLAPLLPPERIFVVTGVDQVEALRASTPQVPPQNFVAEPFGMNTGPAVGLGAIHIQHRDPQAVIAVLTADQHIADKARLRGVLAAAAELALDGYIVTLGIRPDFPATGYGYIQRGAPLRQIGEFQAYRADRFTEKPDLETAKAFLSSGLYSWNSGMFIFRVEQIMAEFARQQPVLHGLLQDIQAALGCPDYLDVLREKWPQMPRLSIDYAVMEGAGRYGLERYWKLGDALRCAGTRRGRQRSPRRWSRPYSPGVEENPGLQRQTGRDDRCGRPDHRGHRRHPLHLPS